MAVYTAQVIAINMNLNGGAVCVVIHLVNLVGVGH